jgi:hypothetical protein
MRRRLQGLRLPEAAWREDPLARAAGLLGGAMLVAALFATWSFDRVPEPDRALTGWETFAVRDLGLLAAGLAAAAAAAVLAGRRGALVRAGAAGLALLIIVWTFAAETPGLGARIALLGALVVAGSAAWSLLPATRRTALAAALGARPLASNPIVLVLTAGFVWLVAGPLVPLSPGGGTDGSWITALNIAPGEGLDFGTDIAYTYGPLGYLTVPRLYDVGRAEVGLLYVHLAYFALAATVIASARRFFSLPAAAVVAVIVLQCFRIVSPDEQTQFAVVATATLWAFALLRTPTLAARRWALPLLALLGGFAALEALVKLNAGVTIVLVLGAAAVAAWPLRRPFGALAFGGGFAAGVLLLWLGTGNALGALDDYLITSIEIVSGYPGYAYTEEGERAWEYLAAAALVPVVGGLVWQESLGWDLLRRAGAFAIVALVLFSTFKQGFVRHDAHSLVFFATALTLCAGLGLRGPRPGAWAAVAACLVGFLGAAHPVLSEWARPIGTAKATRDAVRALRDPAALTEGARQQTRAAQAIPPEALRLIGDRPVHFFPTETSVAWTQPQTTWRPLPVIQGFVAYTPELTRRNRDRLLAADGPQVLLRTREYSAFEDPETTLAVACRFRELFARRNWQVLERTANRCGRPQLAGRVATTTGEPVRVPPVGDDALLYFRAPGFGDMSLGERLLAAAWKPYDRSVAFDGENGGRLAPSLAVAPNLLKVDPAVDYSPGFRLGLRPREMTLRMTTHGVLVPQRAVRRPVTVEFYRVPLSRPARAGR